MKQFFQKLTPKYFYLNKSFGQNHFTLLDVGSGNHSSSKTKKIFPNCEYHGVDLNKDGYSEEDFAEMSAFYEMDLTKLDYKNIPDNYFDFIRMAHVIEHLTNGDSVIEQLISKLKPGGFIYIEYPGIRSTKLPSMSGSLNFNDDPTHVRVYSVKEISALLKNNNLTVLSAGIRHNLLFILAMPFRIISALLTGKKLQGNMFWDLLGFAEFIYAKK